jgi:hypothetical protein
VADQEGVVVVVMMVAQDHHHHAIQSLFFCQVLLPNYPKMDPRFRDA